MPAIFSHCKGPWADEMAQVLLERPSSDYIPVPGRQALLETEYASFSTGASAKMKQNVTR
jgi:hypothetical protein